jgi:diguanylate cyclase (GGDEF)-like protein
VEADTLAAERLFTVLGGPERRFEITHVRSVDEALRNLQTGSYDVVLLDLAIHEGYGLDSLYRAKVAARSVPIVVLTYQKDEALALKAVRAGAQDYLIKGEVTPQLISRTLIHAVERHRMMNELRHAQQRQKHMATHDMLTGLPNRYCFNRELHAILEENGRLGRPLAVMFFDLDGFKAINDNLGHSVGDELLIDVARRMRELVPRGDLVARLGGDEFVAAIRSTPDPGAVKALAEKIREEIGKAYQIGGIECWVSASIGVSLFPTDGEDTDLLLRRADAAMYHAKAAGRNHVSFFQRAMNDSAVERFEMVNGLREAIRSGELILDFQPQVDVATERLIAAETLVRWRHPSRGIVSPGEFITLAEDTGMIVDLGEWVLRNACEAAASWTQLSDVGVAVNISARQLEQESFLESVEAILRETGLAPGRLELELTESFAANESMIEALSRLRGVGVRTAIDDFGCGYSSLALIKRLPADTLKIDQSFVQGITNDRRDVVILESLVRIARGLGFQVIAEGVETLEQMDTLLSLGCTRLQGYLLGKPFSRESFVREVTRPDALWRLAIERPESWSPHQEDSTSA